ncbi:MAG: GAF domain-containing protein [Candidatus Eisenbacteria sp.]|nr:GAF domain-containing protein [Candidatus Eisenbacteria bacterium]
MKTGSKSSAASALAHEWRKLIVPILAIGGSVYLTAGLLDGHALSAAMIALCGLAAALAYWRGHARARQDEQDRHREADARAAERIAQLGGMLGAIRKIHKIIAHTTESDALIRRVCDALVKTRGYHHAWIVLLDDTGKAVIAAESGLSSHFPRLLKDLKRGTLPDCAQKALKQSAVVLTLDPGTSCASCQLANAYRGGTGITVRLRYAGKTRGLIGASLPQCRHGDREEESLLKELAGGIAHAIHALEMERQYRASAKAKERSELDHRSFFEKMPAGAAHHKIVPDKRGRPVDYEFVQVNAAFEKLTGLKRKDILGKRASQVVPGLKELNTDLVAVFGAVALGGKPTTLELYFNASRKWCSITVYSPRPKQFVTIIHDITHQRNGADSSEGAKDTTLSLLGELPFPCPTHESALDGVHTLIVAKLSEKRSLLAKKLDGWGMRVDTRSLDGELPTVLRKAAARKSPYQIVIFDCSFGGIGAERMGHIVKGDPSLEELVLIALAPTGLKGDAHRFTEAGFSAYLAGPLDQAELFEALTTVWGALTRQEPIHLVTRQTLASRMAARKTQPAEPAATANEPEEQARAALGPARALRSSSLALPWIGSK